VGVKESNAQLPAAYELLQNYPNPFNPRTVVGSRLPVVSNVKLVIYDLLGREVAVLVNERRAAGSYQDAFDGSGLSSGIYIYRLTAGTFVQSRKMVLIK
jgi:glucuronoarabinoxylan endo-1,4-beta-xylanase